MMCVFMCACVHDVANRKMVARKKKSERIAQQQKAERPEEEAEGEEGKKPYVVHFFYF